MSLPLRNVARPEHESGWEGGGLGIEIGNRVKKIMTRENAPGKNKERSPSTQTVQPHRNPEEEKKRKKHTFYTAKQTLSATSISCRTSTPWTL